MTAVKLTTLTVPRLDTVAWLVYIARRQLNFVAVFADAETTFTFPTLSQAEAEGIRDDFRRARAV